MKFFEALFHDHKFENPREQDVLSAAPLLPDGGRPSYCKYKVLLSSGIVYLPFEPGPVVYELTCSCGEKDYV